MKAASPPGSRGGELQGRLHNLPDGNVSGTRVGCHPAPRTSGRTIRGVLGPGDWHTMGVRPAAGAAVFLGGTMDGSTFLAQAGGSNTTFLLSLVLMVAIFYFLLI